MERRSALDRAHRGDILGALGRVGVHDSAPRHTWRGRLLTLLAVTGPGIVVMVSNNDAGGIATYAQAGQDYGLWLLGPLLALGSALFVVLEMAGRLGSVTGAGHARLIFERFGPRWGYFALVDLLALNLLTIITEFIGVALAMDYFGISRYIAIPVATLALILVTGLGGFRRWELAMLVLVALSFLVVPLAAVAGVHHATTGLPNFDADSGTGGLLLLVVAMVGTTISPWQIFFLQSNVVDKRITPRWMGYERFDLAIGTVLFGLGAGAVLITAAVAVGDRGGVFVDAGGVAAALRSDIGGWAGTAFALALLNGSVLGAAAVTLATSYALGDVAGTKHSLHRRWRDAPLFHGSFAFSLVVAATVVLVPNAPLGVVTLGVQALAGVLLPSAALLLLLLCNDRAVLGPWVNPRWLNVVAAVAVGGLLEVSALLTLALLRPGIDLPLVALVLGVVLTAGVVAILAAQARSSPAPAYPGSDWERSTWSMPPLETLPPPAPSRARTMGLVVLRAYLLFAFVLVAVRLTELMLR